MLFVLVNEQDSHILHASNFDISGNIPERGKRLTAILAQVLIKKCVSSPKQLVTMCRISLTVHYPIIVEMVKVWFA